MRLRRRHAHAEAHFADTTHGFASAASRSVEPPPMGDRAMQRSRIFFTIPIFAVSVFALLAAARVEAACTETVSTSDVTGFQEAVISVADLAEAKAVWTEVGGYQILCDLGQPAGVLDPDRPQRELVLRKPGASRGFIRLVRYADAETGTLIRSAAMPWDVGGIFDLYFYVRNVDAAAADLRKRGWQGFNDPVEYTTGPFTVREVLMRGPNGEVLCLMQLIAPPADEARYGHMQGFSWPFNAAITVADFEAARIFFADQLRWRTVMQGEVKSPPGAATPVGLPEPVAQNFGRKFASFTQDEANRDGSIQVLEYIGLKGRDLSARAVPPNLGLLALRVPVSNLAATLAEFRAKGGSLAAEPQRVNLPPYGEVTMATLTGPAGARIELFQLIKP